MLLEQINKDKIKFMKEKMSTELSVVRLILSEAKNKEIALRKELTDTDVIAVINTLTKQLTESLGYAVKCGDINKESEYLLQLKTLKSYLPKQMTLDEIQSLASDVINKTDKTSRNIGNIMKSIMPLVAGKADGKLVRLIVSQLLN